MIEKQKEKDEKVEEYKAKFSKEKQMIYEVGVEKNKLIGETANENIKRIQNLKYLRVYKIFELHQQKHHQHKLYKQTIERGSKSAIWRWVNARDLRFWN